MTEKLEKLTPKHQEFVYEYLKTFNAKRSYAKVYDCSTMSDRTIEASGCRLLRSDKVSSYIRTELEARRAQADLDTGFVLDYLKGAMTLNVQEFATIGKKGMTVKDFKKLPEDITKYIIEITQTETKRGNLVVNFKIFPKAKAIDLLAKHTGVSVERVHHSGKVEINSITDLVDKYSD